MARPILDMTRLPILRVSIPSEPATVDEFEWFLDQLSALLARRVQFVMILDLRKAPSLDGRQRQRLAHHERDHAEAIRLYQRGVVSIVTSPFLRALMKSLVWLLNSPYPTQIVKTDTEAELCAHNFMKGAGEFHAAAGDG